ncbi:OmpW/AlkL family protein [Sphingopyxis yananensis]|uniref:OmpW/AlkL family protein n=1 Tax=Sphingopyxis yananensis TaxID=2886687 RepID=UPI001D0FBC60|nr:OmpW family outer membrane protein [Sphingopyxis yananensis]MCC2602211.1 outer membrane beta-barrel protein [Sphingopyxis yananensis]
MKQPLLPLFALMAALAVPQGAQAKAGDLDIKLFATYVAADGKIDSVKYDGLSLPAGTASKANDNVTPTMALQYFVSDHISLETIAGLTQHDIDGAGALGGTELASNVKILPATVTVKYHFGADGGVRPYVGAGPSYFIFIDEKSGSTTQTMGASRLKVNDTLGAAFQAGIDVPLNTKGMTLSLDAKRYIMRPTATWHAGETMVLKTRQRLDPWLISAGLGFRF